MTAKRITFQNPALQKQFERKGYVVVRLLEETDVKQLLSVPGESNHQHQNEFYTTTWLTDVSARLEANRILREKLAGPLDKILLDYRYHYGNFFIKKPGNDGHCYAHQDWSMVEEPRYTSVTVWCALMDMTPENGCLRALKGSHQIDNYVRGRNTYDYLHLSSAFIHKYLMQNIPMKAGEAIIFNQRLIHGSQNNHSSKNRIACGIVGVPAEAEIIHYAAKKDHPEQLRMLDAENDFYARYDTFDPLEELPAIKHVKVEERYLQKKEVLSRYLTDWFWR